MYNFSFLTGFLLVREILSKLHKPSKGTDYWLHVSSVLLYLQMGLVGLQIEAIVPLYPIQQGSGPHPVHNQRKLKGSRVTEAGWLCVLRFYTLVLINKFLVLSCDQPFASFLVYYPLSFARAWVPPCLSFILSIILSRLEFFCYFQSSSAWPLPELSGFAHQPICRGLCL